MDYKKTIRNILLDVTPTFTYPLIRRIVTSPFAQYLENRANLSFFSPQWTEIKNGPFAGIQLYLDPSSNFWRNETSDGMHDADIFSYILKKRMEGKVVFDIGAHIGFNTLCFAKLVGEKGKVIAFEPNVFNRRRMKMNLSKNFELAKCIVLSPVALSNKNGSVLFHFSNAIEDGTSSGSVIESAMGEKQKEVYKTYGFQKVRVKTQTLDSYVKAAGIHPDLIKIDVEGAETLVLEGARKTLQSYHPTLLIELHTILNSHLVTKILAEYSYRFTTLRTESDGRTFIAAVSVKK